MEHLDGGDPITGTITGAITDEELTALAMAADRDQPLGPGAVPISFAVGAAAPLLPAWYMPSTSPVRGRVRRGVFAGIVLALLAVNCAGLCVTYGFPEIAW